MRTVCAFLIAFLAGVGLYGLDANGGGPPTPPVRPGPAGAARSETDSNSDGKIDFIVYFDKAGAKEHEEYDFNSDEKMDDYLYFTNGIPSREEIDSNFDGKIDVWVYLIQGKYIERYAKDTNGDGVPDVVRDFRTQ
jgi:hypothetical protein